MKKLLSKLALMLVVALVMGLGIAVPAMATPPTNVRKTLTVPEGVTVPASGFTFTFNFAQVPAAATPALDIPNQTITIPAGGTAPVPQVSAAITSFLEGFRSTTGLNAGIRDWEVREVIPGVWPVGNAEVPVPGMTYDQSRFILRVHFSNNLDAGGQPIAGQPPLNVAFVEVFRTHDRLGNVVLPGPTDPPGSPGLKYSDGLAFVNAFAPTTGRVDDPALRVSKTITEPDRAHANLNQLFEFNLALAAPVHSPSPPPPPAVPVVLPSPITAHIMTGPVATPTAAPNCLIRTTNVVTITNGTANFLMRDGEWLRIVELPAGTTYTVTETGVPLFTPSAVVVGGTAAAANFSAAEGANLAANGTVHNVPVSNYASFSNQYRFITPAGLVIANAPFFAVGFAALALTLMLASRSRKRIEEMPIAY